LSWSVHFCRVVTDVGAKLWLDSGRPCTVGNEIKDELLDFVALSANIDEARALSVWHFFGAGGAD
jgi:hypothetical protein